MNDKSQISYWYEDECILTVPTHSVPGIGEQIHFNTKMDEHWYEARFPNKKLFREGIRGTFVVTHIKRYYKNYDYVIKEGNYELPAQKTVEEFEVHLEKLN
jgi:hypothetical protein